MFDKIIKSCVGILPEKLQKIYYKYEEAIMYTFFGALTTLVGIVTKLIIFYAVPGKPVWESTAAVAFSWICAVTFAFFTNKKYVFKNETHTSKEFWKVFFSFYGARAVTFAMEEVIFLVFYNWLGMNEVIVTFGSQVLIFIANYVLSKLMVFRKKS
ncbi:GtrA family protein [Porcipelethomonas sp.]|uniref:GtrA family protein n=1 Tax=Porcipelethomonas sp. TaxID=2981675 RepID=UPI003EF1BBAE